MRIARFVFGVVAVLAPITARGQRGLPSSEQPQQTPLSGFPSVYDTFTAPEGAFVGQATATLLPLLPIVGLPVDYGVSENLTIGSNAVFPILWSARITSMGAKVRYRIVPHSRIALAVTGYLYWLSSDGGKSTDMSSGGMQWISYGTLNGSYFLSDRTWFTGHIGRFSSFGSNGEPKDSDFSRTNTAIIMWGGGGEHFFSDWFGVRVMGVVPFSIDVESDAGLAASAPVAGTTSFYAMDSAQFSTVNVSVDFRFWERWMISIGRVYSEQSSLTGYTLDVARRW